MSSPTDTSAKPGKIAKSDAEWRIQLTPEQYHVTREHGTERAFTGPFVDEKRAGLYTCVCCGEPLFLSETKFDSGEDVLDYFDLGRVVVRRGGARPGAGRKPLGKIRKQVLLTEAIVAKINRIAKKRQESFSATVESACAHLG